MGKNSKVAKEEKPRKTLVDLQAEVGVKDPSTHAKRQVAEQNKAALRSLAQRKAKGEAMIADKKELKHIEDEINGLRKNYEPLCAQLKEKEEKKKYLMQQLELCIKNQQKIMENVKQTVIQRKLDDMKLSSKMASSNLAAIRGYSLDTSSTFQQTRSPANTMTLSKTKTGRPGSKSASALPALGGAGKELTRNTSSVL
jgi:hypothetical protein